MSHGYTTAHGWLVDRHGRHALLRGVNLAGSSKLPYEGDSFVGRPAPLDQLDGHLDRIAGWGFNCLRLLTTWEAIEHDGPGAYDEAYLDHYREVVRRAGQRGLVPDRFEAAGVVQRDGSRWWENYDRAPVATMFTLFLAGDRVLPELAGVQGELQGRYCAAVAALAERLADLDNVLGYDTMNEPSYGFLRRSADLPLGHLAAPSDEPMTP